MPLKWILPVCAALRLSAQTFTAEADPDFYFDRGVTMAVGIKPSPESRWTFLADFASRKAGPVKDGERLQPRLGGSLRYRFYGRRSGAFAQLGFSYDRFRSGTRTDQGFSARPGVGVQWFPWENKGFYAAPLLSIENLPGRNRASARLEIRIGWQF